LCQIRGPPCKPASRGRDGERSAPDGRRSWLLGMHPPPAVTRQNRQILGLRAAIPAGRVELDASDQFSANFSRSPPWESHHGKQGLSVFSHDGAARNTLRHEIAAWSTLSRLARCLQPLGPETPQGGTH
jgi:hypothetical protein